MSAVTLNDLIGRARNTNQVTISAPLIQAAVEKVQKEKEERAVNLVTNLVSQFESQLSTAVQTLRQYRKMEKAQEKLVDKIDRAFRYFAATGNPLPMYKAIGRGGDGAWFCTNLGIEMPSPDDAAWSVPDDWQPEQG